MTEESELFLREGKIVNLSFELFKRTAIILHGFASQSVTIRSRKHEHRIQVAFPGFPYLGIWSALGGAPFVCIEPWYGVISKKSDRTLEDKEGILILEPKKSFGCSYSIRVE